MRVQERIWWHILKEKDINRYATTKSPGSAGMVQMPHLPRVQGLQRAPSGAWRPAALGPASKAKVKKN